MERNTAFKVSVWMITISSNFVKGSELWPVQGQECQLDANSLSCKEKGFTDLDFSFIPNFIEELNFSRNQLEDICHCEWPSNLTNLDLSRNQISNLDSDCFGVLKSLKTLNLSKNKLTSVGANAFRGLNTLSTLNLAKNKILKLDVRAFDGLHTLERLDLSLNYFGISHGWNSENFLDPLNNLKYLDLSQCSLSFLPLFFFQNNTKLTEISLSRNLFPEVPITQLHRVKDTLEFLDMSENLIVSLPSHTFHGLRHLKTLIMNNMAHFVSIEALAFHDLASLATIQMENNQDLAYIDPFAFHDSFYDKIPIDVSNVYLANNGLEHLSANLLHWKTLETISLAGNPLRCDCNMAWIVHPELGVTNKLSEELVCRYPDHLSNTPLKNLNSKEFECNEVGYPTMDLFFSYTRFALVIVFAVLVLMGVISIVRRTIAFKGPRNYIV